jgi:hypothetical protein
MTLLLAVDPSETKRFVQRVGIRDGGFSRVLFENAQPNSVRLPVIRRQPLAPFGG